MNNRKLTGGIFLIVLGALFLLANLGYISFDMLFGVFDLWPLLLVVAGINILFNRKPIIVLITWIIFFTVLILYGTFYEKVNTGVDFKTHFVKPVETSYGELNLNMGAARINVDSEKDNLLKVDARGIKLDHNNAYKNDMETAIFNFANKNHSSTVYRIRDSSYNFKLNEDVIWDLDLNLGTVSATLNLENIATRTVDLDMGAGNFEIILGNKYNKSDIKIDSGASNINITVPKDAGIKIKLDGSLNRINIDDLNLIRLGDYYISPDYDEKDVKLAFRVNMSVGKVDFRVK